MSRAKLRGSIPNRLDRVLKVYAAFLGRRPDQIIRAAIHNQLVAGFKAAGLKGKIDKTSANLHHCKGGIDFINAVKKFDTWEQVIGYLHKKDKLPKEQMSGQADTNPA